MSNQGNNEYYVDVVLCIDGTGSMRKFIGKVKACALSIHSMLEEEMILLNKLIHQSIYFFSILAY